MKEAAPDDTTAPAPAPVTALVLAGGDASDALAAAVGAPAKALVPLKGRPLGAYVLDALLGAALVRRIVWVGAADAEMRSRVDLVVPGGPRLADSLAIGLGAVAAEVQGGERLLLVSADIPWLGADNVDRFVTEAGTEHDLVYPVVSREACEAEFPSLARTWVRLAGGDVTGGNVMLARPETLRALLPWVDLATRDRKAPVRLAWRLGPGMLIALLAGRATLPMLEARVGRLLGADVRAIASDDATLGSDIDRIEQLPATLRLSDGRAAVQRDEPRSA
ncbi:MAG: NTP transferase domain-containing protein [Trueperaceae bacterium]|nr:NTP transferase domain-containing protein [Trueperaceae bacterium]